LELEKIGAVAIDRGKFLRSSPTMPSGISPAVDNISLSNTLSIGPQVPAALMPIPGQPPNFSHGRPYPKIENLEEILGG
jgi:hypothetical protein